MTSCLLVKAPDRIVVVADGRLSVSSTAISFDTAQKIIRFTPTYRIPIVDRGWFSRYSDRTAQDWCIAYSGNVALASEIHRLFIARVTGGLFLTWDSGKPVLKDSFDETAQFADYDFRSSELVQLTPAILAERLRLIAKGKCDEFALNRRAFPDCQFLLFGRDEQTRDWTAFKLYANDADWSAGRTASLILDEIADGCIAAIGSPSVSGSAYSDDPLKSGLTDWKGNKSRLEVDEFLSNFSMDDPSPRREDTTRKHDPNNWTASEVAGRLMHHIRSSTDPAVGGDILVASGADHGEITLRSA